MADSSRLAVTMIRGFKVGFWLLAGEGSFEFAQDRSAPHKQLVVGQFEISCMSARGWSRPLGLQRASSFDGLQPLRYRSG
jgi:hypothetical protein